MVRVLIVDDHPVVRAGLKQILSEEPDMVVAGEAPSGNDALQSIREGTCDVVLLDIAMPGRNGIETLGRIKEEWPDLPVLILSIYPEDQYAVRLLKAGAAGYMTKESASDLLVSAIRKVSQGKKYVSPHLAELLADKVAGGDQPLHETLSDREYQIFFMIAAGKAVSEIASELSLSVKTVSTYRTRVLDKMRMSKNAELTYYAIKNRLME